MLTFRKTEQIFIISNKMVTIFLSLINKNIDITFASLYISSYIFFFFFKLQEQKLGKRKLKFYLKRFSISSP